MTQIQTPVPTSIITGPRGLGARSQGGAFSQDAIQDLIDSDSFQGPITLLSGSSDILNPQAGGNYVVKTAGVNAMTLAAPRVGLDDGVTINVWSDTTNAHTITCPSAIVAAGVALKTVITLPAFRGGGVTLRAYNGVWQIIGQGFTAVGLA